MVFNKLAQPYLLFINRFGRIAILLVAPNYCVRKDGYFFSAIEIKTFEFASFMYK
jgi:hypothetical protein